MKVKNLTWLYIGFIWKKIPQNIHYWGRWVIFNKLLFFSQYLLLSLKASEKTNESLILKTVFYIE
jgi:hypothetical protein